MGRPSSSPSVTRGTSQAVNTNTSSPTGARDECIILDESSHDVRYPEDGHVVHSTLIPNIDFKLNSEEHNKALQRARRLGGDMLEAVERDDTHIHAPYPPTYSDVYLDLLLAAAGLLSQSSVNMW